MNIERLQEILIDQKEMEVDSFNPSAYCERPEERFINLDSHLAQVVLGVRRCGKSTLCMNVLKKSRRSFGYVNFDDERLAKLTGENLNDLLIALYKVYGECKLIFMDEMQNIPEWFLFANRLLRQGIHLVITGSNAKLLSGELSTHLTGRYMETRLLPFSFTEFCAQRGISTSIPASTLDTARRSAAFDDYLHRGGFPELSRESDSVGYVSALLDSIVQRDIAQRYNIRNRRELIDFANHLLNVVPTKCRVSDYTRLLGVKSDHTTKRYLSYFEQAYLLSAIQKYSTKSSQRIVNEKLYPIDVAFMDCRPNAFVGENRGWRLETLVYLELRRRYSRLGYDIYYYADRSFEVDFLVCKNRQVEEIIQVAYDVSSEKTRGRELKGLQSAARETGCWKLTLVTYDQRQDAATADGHPVAVVPAHEWFCRAG